MVEGCARFSVGGFGFDESSCVLGFAGFLICGSYEAHQQHIQLGSCFQSEKRGGSVQRENGEVGVSGRDYAFVPGEMWVQALRW